MKTTGKVQGIISNIVIVRTEGAVSQNEICYITVGGVKLDGEKASFSSVGPTYDGRIKPDVMAYAYAVTVASPGNNYFEGNGTSYACPSLAGMAACLWQARRDKSAAEIREIIKMSGDNYISPNSECGYGIPDFMKALDTQNLKDCDIFDEKSMFYVYPNPSDGMVKFDINYHGNAVIQVLDLMGGVIYIVDNHNDGICDLNACLSKLNSGIYLVRVIASEFDQSMKLIKY